MNSATPLVFRPSLSQRVVTALLCAGSWLAGGRTLLSILHGMPRLWAALELAKAQGEGLWFHRMLLAAGLLACLLAGLLLLASLLAFLFVEGSQVVVDDFGISVEHTALPGPLARRLGADRLTWKQVSWIGKRRLFFEVKGEGRRLRFLMVDQMERLILLIFEKSPNLKADP